MLEVSGENLPMKRSHVCVGEFDSEIIISVVVGLPR